jgi:hypothetical protein
MNCNECKYCILLDYGYSNYTVEGTTADCLRGLNPGLPKDHFYGEQEELKFAETCKSFIAGDNVYIDVEQEDGALENYSDDEEIKELLRKY